MIFHSQLVHQTSKLFSINVKPQAIPVEIVIIINPNRTTGSDEVMEVVAI